MTEILPQEGQKAPDFTLPNADETLISLSDFRGGWLVLYFYPKDNTAGCTREASEFTELIEQFEKMQAKVVGISKDSPKSHRSFKNKHGLRVELLSDRELDALTAYGAWRKKKVCGRECMGTVRSTYLIDPNGIIRRAWHNVSKTAGHAQNVYEELTSLTKG